MEAVASRGGCGLELAEMLLILGRKKSRRDEVSNLSDCVLRELCKPVGGSPFAW